MKNIAIFVSGTGSNARKIIEYFQGHSSIQCTLLISNKASALALEMAKEKGLDTLVLKRKSFYEETVLLDALAEASIDFIVLAGFLWLVPDYLVKAYPQKIVNIHPALLPKYGGKGMYGHHVHQAVKDKQETESGMTIHYVNEHYDEGAIIFQASCTIDPDDSAETIGKKVLQLEHLHFAPQIEKVLMAQNNL
ncbi:MAG: phosphoribosylglycinamide formyltransferase [Bacteroidota bacterium]